MKIKTFLFILAFLSLGFCFSCGMNTRETQSQTANSKKFVALPISSPDTKDIVIVAPENCPRDGARRAEALAKELSRQGLPFIRSHEVGFSSSSSDQKAFDKVNEIMTGEQPIVFINGKAKANPTIDEVIKEYKASKN